MVRFSLLSVVVLGGASLVGCGSKLDFGQALSQMGITASSENRPGGTMQGQETGASLSGEEQGPGRPGGMSGKPIPTENLSPEAKAVFKRFEEIQEAIAAASARLCGVDASARTAMKAELDAIEADASLSAQEKHEKARAVFEAHRDEAEAARALFETCRSEKGEELAKDEALSKSLRDACLVPPPARGEGPQGGMRHEGGRHGGKGMASQKVPADLATLQKELETKLLSTACGDVLTAVEGDALLK